MQIFRCFWPITTVILDWTPCVIYQNARCKMTKLMKLARLNTDHSALKNWWKCKNFKKGDPMTFGDPYLMTQEVSIQNFNGFGLRLRSPSKPNKN